MARPSVRGVARRRHADTLVSAKQRTAQPAISRNLVTETIAFVTCGTK